MMPELMIEPLSLEVTGDRVRVSIRMPWYRALPFSSVASVKWNLDGLQVPANGMTWSCDGTTLGVDQLPARHDLWWYILDSAVVEGDRPAGFVLSPEVSVELTLGLFIPYITTDLGVLRLEERDRKSMPLVSV
jgi:hypothetical protein